MKKIIVTGCNGQLGRAINLELAGNPELEFVNTDVNELDITNIDEVLKLAREVKPYAIINCAAHTAVDACETDVDNAYRINAIGPRNLSIAATQTGAKMVHISTDYVFNGKSDHPYIEFDTPDPQGIYGKTKLQGENMVKQFADRFFIFRMALWRRQELCENDAASFGNQRSGQCRKGSGRKSYQYEGACGSDCTSALYRELRIVPCNL